MHKKLLRLENTLKKLISHNTIKQMIPQLINFFERFVNLSGPSFLDTDHCMQGLYESNNLDSLLMEI